VVLDVALLDEEHDAGDAGHGEGAVGEEGDGDVQFRPWLERLGRGPGDRRSAVEGGDDPGELEEEDEGRGEQPEQREPVGGSEEEVDEGHRPGEEDEDLRQAGDGAAPVDLAAQVEEAGLEDEAEGDGDEVPARLAVAPGGEAEQRVDDAAQEEGARDG